MPAEQSEFSKNINLANIAIHEGAACKVVLEGLSVLKHALLHRASSKPWLWERQLRANPLPCHFWQGAAAFGGVWQARLETLGSIGHMDVVCSRFDTRKVGPAAVGSASSGRAVDSIFQNGLYVFNTCMFQLFRRMSVICRTDAQGYLCE